MPVRENLSLIEGTFKIYTVTPSDIVDIEYKILIQNQQGQEFKLYSSVNSVIKEVKVSAPSGAYGIYVDVKGKKGVEVRIAFNDTDVYKGTIPPSLKLDEPAYFSISPTN